MCFWLSHRLPGRSEPQATVASTTVNDCKRVPSHISTVVNKLNPPCRQGPVHNLDLGTHGSGQMHKYGKIYGLHFLLIIITLVLLPTLTIVPFKNVQYQRHPRKTSYSGVRCVASY